jgi:hypothetical protein
MKRPRLHLVSTSDSTEGQPEERSRRDRTASCPRCGADLSVNGVKVRRTSPIVTALASLGAYWVTVPSYRGRRVDAVVSCGCGYRGSRALGTH